MKNRQLLPRITLIAGLISLVSYGGDKPTETSKTLRGKTQSDPALEAPKLRYFDQRFSLAGDHKISILNLDSGELSPCEHSDLSVVTSGGSDTCGTQDAPFKTGAEMDDVITPKNNSPDFRSIINEPPGPGAATSPLHETTAVVSTSPCASSEVPPVLITASTTEHPLQPCAALNAFISPTAPITSATLQTPPPTINPSAKGTPELAAPNLVDAEDVIIDKYQLVDIEFINVGGGELSDCRADLPAGLQVSVTSDNNSCEINGEALEAYSGESIQVIASNHSGNSSAEFTLVINEVREYITHWRTHNIGVTNSNQLLLETSSNFVYSFRVDWGDGQVDRNVSESIIHNYELAGDYTVKISGNYPKPHQSFVSDSKKLLRIDQWGDQVWQSMESAFFACENLELRANDIPNLSQVSSMASMFRNTRAFNGNITNWDVSAVTDMSDMFHEALSFNRDLSNWNVAQVRNMNSMFFKALNFDQNLGSWDLSSVTDMRYMFDGSGLSTANYDSLLIGLQALDLQHHVHFDAGYSTDSNSAASARADIINRYNWRINDSSPNN